MDFVCVSKAAAGTVETIIPPSWEDVHVVVPYVLVAVRLVVLTSRDAVAAEGCLHGDGGRTNGSLNWRAQLDRQVIHVLVVIIRNDQHRTWVPRPPLGLIFTKTSRRDERTRQREVRCPSRQIPTEGTAITRRLVVVHEAIFVAGESLGVVGGFRVMLERIGIRVPTAGAHSSMSHNPNRRRMPDRQRDLRAPSMGRDATRSKRLVVILASRPVALRARPW